MVEHGLGVGLHHIGAQEDPCGVALQVATCKTKKGSQKISLNQVASRAGT